MEEVRYEIATDGTIVFVVEVAGFGPAKVTSARKGIFSCRVNDRTVLAAALRQAEVFADAHELELAPYYDSIAKRWSGRSVA